MAVSSICNASPGIRLHINNEHKLIDFVSILSFRAPPLVFSFPGIVRHLITPPLNDQILPGITRDSLLTLTRAHIASEIIVEGFPEPSKLVVEEQEFTLSDLKKWSDEGRIKESFGAGTAASEWPKFWSFALSPPHVI